jgi:hypothetical protein
MNTPRTIRTAALLAGAGLLALAGPAAAQLRSKTAAISKFDGVDNNDKPCTSSTTFVNIPSMSRTWTQGGAANDEVAVLFQGSGWFVEDTNNAAIRLTIDGAVVPGPGAASDLFVFGADPVGSPGDPQNTSHGFNFQSNAVAPGQHTARIQWASLNGTEICVGPRSLLVLHK